MDELQKYFTAALLHLYENKDKEIKLSSVLDPLPSQYRESVYNKLWTHPMYMKGNPGIDPLVQITAVGIGEAKKLAIEKYKLDVFKAFEEYGIGNEVVWNNFAAKTGVPESFIEPLKNILYYQGYMYKTSEAQGIGHLVKSLPSISASLYQLEDEFSYSTIYNDHSVSQTFVAGGDISGSGNVHSGLEKAFNRESIIETTTNTSNANSQKSFWQKIWSFVISNIWKILVALLTAYIVYKFGWNN